MLGSRFIRHYALLMAGLLFFTVSHAQNNRVFMMVQTSQSNGAKCDPAALKAKLLADLQNAMQQKFPCASFTADSDMAALLNWESQRQLLGNYDSDGSRMAAIAGGLGAQYLVQATVQASGDQVVFNGSETGVAASRSSSRATIVSSCEKAIDDAEKFANQLAAGMSGAGAPKCKGTWQGTITVVRVVKREGPGPNGKPESWNDTSTLTCELTGAGQDARCSYDGSSGMKGEKGSMTTSTTGKDAQTWATVSTGGGKLALQTGSFQGLQTMSVSGVPLSIPPTDVSIDGESFDNLPLQSSPNSQSGSWSKTVSEASVTVTWSLRMK